MSVLSGKFPTSPLRTSPQDSQFTYKDLHDLSSSATSFKSPLAIIGHIDMNAFFAQVEQVRLGYSIDDPVVCVQWASLIAVSYAARKFGVNRMDSITTAREKCPQVILAHAAVFKKGESHWTYIDELPSPLGYKVSLDPYRRESRKILKIIYKNCKYIEKASVDECYLDLGELVYEKAIKEFESYFDVSRLTNEKDMNVPLPRIPDELPSFLQWKGEVVASEKEEEENEYVQIKDWDDIVILWGCNILYDIRKQIFENLGYTTSGGIGRTKSLAKLSGGFKKPDGQTIIRTRSIPGFLQKFEINDFSGMGGKIGESIIESLKLPPKGSVFSLREKSLEELTNALKDSKLSEKVYNLVRGNLKVELNPRIEIKSMTSNKNFRPYAPLKNLQDAIDWLKVYTGDLYGRLVELDEENYDDGRGKHSLRRPRTVSIHLRTLKFITHSKQCSISVVKSLDVLRGIIFESGVNLLKGLSNQLIVSNGFDNNNDEKNIIPCSLMSLTISNFDKVNESNLIETYFKDNSNESHIKELFIKAQNEATPLGAPQLKSSPAKPKIDIFQSLQKKKRPLSSPINLELITTTECHICNIPIADINEHKDYHIALDLSNQLNNDEVSPPRSSRSSKTSNTKPVNGNKKSKVTKGQSILPF